MIINTLENAVQLCPHMQVHFRKYTLFSMPSDCHSVEGIGSCSRGHYRAIMTQPPKKKCAQIHDTRTPNCDTIRKRVSWHHTRLRFLICPSILLSLSFKSMLQPLSTYCFCAHDWVLTPSRKTGSFDKKGFISHVQGEVRSTFLVSPGSALADL